jgi:hypothetical protein
MKFKLKLLQIKCHVLEFTKDETQKMLQRQSQFLWKRSSLTTGTYSSPKKRMGLLGRPTPVSPSREPSPHRSESPTDGPRRRRQKEEDPHLHTNK